MVTRDHGMIESGVRFPPGPPDRKLLATNLTIMENISNNNQNQQLSSGRGKVLAYLILGASVVVPGLFFFGKWAVNAESFGKYDLGYGIFFSIAVASLIYISLGLAFLNFLVALINFLRHRPARRYLLAMIITLLPIIYLFLLDILSGHAFDF